MENWGGAMPLWMSASLGPWTAAAKGEKGENGRKQEPCKRRAVGHPQRLGQLAKLVTQTYERVLGEEARGLTPQADSSLWLRKGTEKEEGLGCPSDPGRCGVTVEGAGLTSSENLFWEVTSGKVVSVDAPETMRLEGLPEGTRHRRSLSPECWKQAWGPAQCTHFPGY